MRACRLLLAYATATTMWGGVAIGQIAPHTPISNYGPPGQSGVEPAGYVMFGGDEHSGAHCGPEGCNIPHGGEHHACGPGYGPVSHDVCSYPVDGEWCGDEHHGGEYHGGHGFEEHTFGDSYIDQCCDCGPRWILRAGGIAMKRVSTSNSLVRFNGGPGNPAFQDVINERDFDFEHGYGADVSGLFSVDGCTTLELRYMWFDDSQDNLRRVQSAAGPPPPAPPFNNVLIATAPPTIFALPPNSSVSAEYRSGVDSGEINVRSQSCGRFTWIAGFRYINLDESLLLRINAPGNQIRFATDNDMYGFQVGTELALAPLSERFSFDAIFKGGVYYNDVSTSVSDSGFFAAAPRTITSGDDTVSFAGEAGMYATWRVSSRWALRAGYQALWLHSVATAGEQAGVSGSFVVPGPPLTLNPESDGNAIYHGANFSLIAEF